MLSRLCVVNLGLATVLVVAGCGSSNNSPSNTALAGGSGAAAGGAAAGGTSSSGGSGGAQKPPPHVVSACPLRAVGAATGDAGATTPSGMWENVTPPMLNLDSNFQTPAGGNFGAHALAVDPSNNAIVYLGTSAQGIFKTTDCGATWALISQGAVNTGRNGTMVIDPINPQVLYTDARYGPLGVFKSTNGGVDWTQILPADVLSAFPSVESIAMDPTNHSHLIVSPHFTCMGSHSANCIIETTNSGDSWKFIENTPESSELSGLVMVDSKTWLVAQPFGGIFRTGDSGTSWTHVYSGGSGPAIVQTSDGTYYMPGNLAGVLYSKDTISWTAIASAGQSATLAASKTALITTIGLNSGGASSAPITNLMTWAPMKDMPVANGQGGWMIAGDADHDIVYSSNFGGGLWRYVFP